jgi:type I restriction enzyme S subunit
METEVLDKKKTLVPKLRFKGFTDSWYEKSLGEIFKINAGGDIDETHVSAVQTEKHKYPIYANAEKNKGFYAYSDIYKVEAGTITIAGRGVNIGIAHARDHKFYPIVRLLVLIPLNDEDINFGEYAINRINLFPESTGVPQLTVPQVSGYKIAIPTLPEQQKIASFLSAVDEKVQQLSRKKELLEQYKKGVMQQLFSGKLRFKDENGKAFPKWEEKRLGDIGDTFNGLSGKTKENFGEGKPYIQYMQIFSSSKIDVTKCGLVQIGDNENQPHVQYGDVFFTTSSETPNEIGTCSVLLDETLEMYLNSFCFGFRPNSLELLVPSFASYLFRNEIFRRKIIKLAQGSTRYNMSKVQLLKLKVLLPGNIEQKKIANYLSNIDSKIESVTKQITETQTFKKGLLQQMFV